MNYQKIEKDFKSLENNTKKLINKYNKSVDSIKSQELAISKVKNKLNDLISGNKIPTSIRNLETELKRSEKEVSLLQKQYDSLMDDLENKQEQSINLKGNISDDAYLNLTASINNLETQSDNLAAELDVAKDKAFELKSNLENAKLNINSSFEIQELTTKLENMNSKLSQTKDEANQTKDAIKESFDKKHSLGFGNGIEEIGKKIDKFKSKMTRLIGTAMVFSLLRNGLTKLRNGFISLLNTNDTFKNSMNQIKQNLMTAFMPIYNACLPAINSLMNAISRITGTIAKFVSTLFGTSLEDAKKQAQGLTKALDGTKKSSEEASGSLAGFDKLEVIGSGSDNSAGGGIGLSSGNDFDGEIQYSQRLLDFLNQIKDFVINNKEIIIGLFTGLAIALVLVKLGIDGIMALGIGLIIGGIVTLIQGIINFINDPSWNNFATILTGLAMILGGVAIAMLAVNAANPVAWIMLAIAAIIAIVALIIKNWDTIKEVLGKAGEWFYNTIIKPIVGFFEGMWNGLVNGAKSAWDGIKSVFSTVASFFKNIFSNAWNGVKAVFSTGGKIFDGIKDGILNGFKTVVNTIIKGINKVVKIPFDGINTALKKVRDISFLGISPFKGLIKTVNVPQIPQLAQGDVIPPRHKFMAILGDQKHGTNIEAPLETIKQANREVLAEFFNQFKNLSNDIKEIVFKNFTIVAQFGNKDFQKLVIEAVRLTEKEIGKPLFIN